MKRQIIKTRPQRPYRVARIVIVLVLIVVIVVVALVLEKRLTLHGSSVAEVAIACRTSNFSA